MGEPSQSGHTEFIAALERLDVLCREFCGIRPLVRDDGAGGLRHGDFQRMQELAEEIFCECEEVFLYAAGFYWRTGECFLRVPRHLRKAFTAGVCDIGRWDELQELRAWSLPDGMHAAEDEVIGLPAEFFKRYLDDLEHVISRFSP